MTLSPRTYSGRAHSRCPHSLCLDVCAHCWGIPRGGLTTLAAVTDQAPCPAVLAYMQLLEDYSEPQPSVFYQTPQNEHVYQQKNRLLMEVYGFTDSFSSVDAPPELAPPPALPPKQRQLVSNPSHVPSLCYPSDQNFHPAGLRNKVILFLRGRFNLSFQPGPGAATSHMGALSPPSSSRAACLLLCPLPAPPGSPAQLALAGGRSLPTVPYIIFSLLRLQ